MSCPGDQTMHQSRFMKVVDHELLNIETFDEQILLAIGCKIYGSEQLLLRVLRLNRNPQLIIKDPKTFLQQLVQDSYQEYLEANISLEPLQFQLQEPAFDGNYLQAVNDRLCEQLEINCKSNALLLLIDRDEQFCR